MSKNKQDYDLLECECCGGSYYLVQFDDKGQMKDGCPMSYTECICGSKDIKITNKEKVVDYEI